MQGSNIHAFSVFKPPMKRKPYTNNAAQFSDKFFFSDFSLELRERQLAALNLLHMTAQHKLAAEFLRDGRHTYV